MLVCQITPKVTSFSLISVLEGDKDDHRWKGGSTRGQRLADRLYLKPESITLWLAVLPHYLATGLSFLWFNSCFPRIGWR